jgi:molybdopterin-guanine dinucleotide biosynthesis protein A
MKAVDDFTAFVLAGGKSTRMGVDKTLLELKGKSLLGRALDLLRSITPEVIIVGERSKFTRIGFVVEDVFRERGPLGGIHAALAATATELNLVLAVDLPFVEAGFLKYLLKAAAENTALVTLPRTSAGWQPLCAVYRREFGMLAERSLLQGKNKIDPLFAGVEIHPIDEAEITRRGFSAAMFRNLNTPEEFESAKRQRSQVMKTYRGTDA